MEKLVIQYSYLPNRKDTTRITFNQYEIVLRIIKQCDSFHTPEGRVYFIEENVEVHHVMGIGIRIEADEKKVEGLLKKLNLKN